MKITIDTKEDSPDELRKVIRMLSSLVGKEVMSNEGDIFKDDKDDKDDNNQPETSDAFNMFNNPQPENQTEEEPKEEKKDDDEIDIDDIPF